MRLARHADWILSWGSIDKEESASTFCIYNRMHVCIRLFDQLSASIWQWKHLCYARAYLTVIDKIDRYIINHMYSYSTSTDADPPNNRNMNIFLQFVVWKLTPICIYFRETRPSDSTIETGESLRDWGAVWRIFYTFCTTNFSAFLITPLFLHLLFSAMNSTITHCFNWGFIQPLTLLVVLAVWLDTRSCCSVFGTSNGFVSCTYFFYGL